jgi:hypothetical protein
LGINRSHYWVYLIWRKPVLPSENHSLILFVYIKSRTLVLLRIELQWSLVAQWLLAVYWSLLRIVIATHCRGWVRVCGQVIRYKLPTLRIERTWICFEIWVTQLCTLSRHIIISIRFLIILALKFANSN